MLCCFELRKSPFGWRGSRLSNVVGADGAAIRLRVCPQPQVAVGPLRAESAGGHIGPPLRVQPSKFAAVG
jgi:hypothetical protein